MSWLERMRRRRYVAGLAADRLWLAPAPDAPAAGAGILFPSGSTDHALEALASGLKAATGASATSAAGAGQARRQESVLDVVVDVVLDGSHVRWKLVDQPPGAVAARDRQAIVAHQFGEAGQGADEKGGSSGNGGNASAGWAIRAAEQPGGWKAPAGAVDAQLVERLASACRDAGARLGRVRPYFSAAFDHWRRSIADDSYWFCVLDPGSVGLGLLYQGQWQGLVVRRPSGDWRSQVATLQAQLAIPAGIDTTGLPGYLVDARLDHGGSERPEAHASPDLAGDAGFRRLGPVRPVPARLAHGI